jgi:hypothetical protein
VSDPIESTDLTLVVEKFNLGTLTTNAKALLAAVKAKLSSYTIDNYSGDRIQEAKKDRAKLNNLFKVLNEQRIEYEKRWMQPFDEFKGLVAETGIEIKKASNAIDQLIKDVEAIEKEEKRQQIDEYFASLNCNLFRVEQIASAQWLNKTYLLKDIKAEIVARIEKTKMDLAILDKINEPEAKAHYLETLDLNSAMAAADRIKANRERLAAEEKARLEPPEPDYEEERELDFTEPETIPDRTPVPAEKLPTDPIITYTLRLHGTKEALQDLRRYMEAHDITYEKIEE